MSLNGTLRTLLAGVTSGWSRQAFTQSTATGAVIQANNYVQASAVFRNNRSGFGGSLSLDYDMARSLLLNQR